MMNLTRIRSYVNSRNNNLEYFKYETVKNKGFVQKGVDKIINKWYCSTYISTIITIEVLLWL